MVVALSPREKEKKGKEKKKNVGQFILQFRFGGTRVNGVALIRWRIPCV